MVDDRAPCRVAAMVERTHTNIVGSISSTIDPGSSLGSTTAVEDSRSASTSHGDDDSDGACKNRGGTGVNFDTHNTTAISEERGSPKVAPTYSGIYTSTSDTGSRQHVSPNIGAEVDETHVSLFTPSSDKSSSTSARLKSNNDTHSTSGNHFLRRSTRSTRNATHPGTKSDPIVPKAKKPRHLRSQRQFASCDKDTIAVARLPTKHPRRSADTECIIVASGTGGKDAPRSRQKRKITTS
jgi:hypothetical protein